MARQRHDKGILDLFAWEPKGPLRSYSPEKIRAASLRSRVSKAVAVALKESARPRETIAAEMSAYLGEECPKSMLDAYASEAREDHSINVVRFLALGHATGDAQRLLQALAEVFDLAVIPARYTAAIDDAMLSDRIEELAQRQKLSRRSWKGAR